MIKRETLGRITMIKWTMFALLWLLKHIAPYFGSVRKYPSEQIDNRRGIHIRFWLCAVIYFIPILALL